MPTRTPDAARVAAARRWFRQVGYAPLVEDGVTSVRTPAHPDTWDANWAMAGPGIGPDALLATMDQRFAGQPWRVVPVDCLTDPTVEAGLLLAGFTAENSLIEMAATAVAAPLPTPAIQLRRVDDASWPDFARLVDLDQREGKRTGEHDEDVAAGLLDGMRRRLESCSYWLLEEADEAVGYGMTLACPGGLGMIENLWTLPERRRRGLMSGFIVEGARRLSEVGCDAVFLVAHAHDTPKHLYARLGFRPVALTRTWVRQVG